MNIRVFSWHRRRTRSSNLSFSLHSAIALLSALRLDASKTPALPSRLYWPTVAPDAVAECNRISFSFACGALVVRVLVVCVCPASLIYNLQSTVLIYMPLPLPLPLPLPQAAAMNRFESNQSASLRASHAHSRRALSMYRVDSTRDSPTECSTLEQRTV